MALDRFRAPSLPSPPASYDQQYLRQLVGRLELYFSQLDSNAANHAEKYTADYFVGGEFQGKVPSYTTAQRVALSVEVGTSVYDTDEDKLAVYTSNGWEIIKSYWITGSLAAAASVGSVTVTTP